MFIREAPDKERHWRCGNTLFNNKFKQQLKQEGHSQKYRICLNTDDIDEYKSFLSTEYKSKISIFFTFVAYGAIKKAPKMFKTQTVRSDKFDGQIYNTSFNKLKVQWGVKDGHILIFGFN